MGFWLTEARRVVNKAQVSGDHQEAGPEGPAEAERGGCIRQEPEHQC